MKTIFILAKIKSKLDKSKILSLSKKFPKNIAIAYSIQYQTQANEIKNILSSKHKITKFIQVLGCSKPNFPKNTQSILLISDGKFHAVSLATQTKLPVYVLENNQLTKISKKDVELIEKKQKASYVKFLNANKIGILVSTKPGQQNLKKALSFKKKMNLQKSKIFGATKSKLQQNFAGNKKSYLFISNNINTQEFENFGLDSWVNTACPRLDMCSNQIINISRL